MQIGVSVPLLAYRVDVAFMARQAEEHGFESLWCAEHPVMPVHTTSRFPGSADGIIPESYAHLVDPFVALARASGVTTTIKLATGITLVPERNPLLLAKEIATLDRFSGGRFMFGIGAGWLKEETEVMGGNFAHRWSQTREAILALKELWTEEAEFHHIDHSGNNRLFEHAKVYVHVDELEFAYVPGYQARVYNRNDFDHRLQYIPVRGDLEIAKGVHLIQTPGHAPILSSSVVARSRTSPGSESSAVMAFCRLSAFA